MSYKELKDSVPPNNQEAEQAVLGALLIDTRAWDKLSAMLKAEDFYRVPHQKLYRVIADLLGAGKACDIITLTDELRSRKELDIAGGAAYVTQLTQTVPSAANVEYYATIVKECSVRRSMIQVAHDLVAQAHDESRDSRAILDVAEKDIFALANNRKEAGFKAVRDIIPEAVKRIEKAYKTRNAYTGIPSGFQHLDSLTSGFQESDYIIIGARPSMGKTAMALSMAAHMSIHEKIPTGFFSLEMPDFLIMQRLIAMEAKVNSHSMRTGMLKPADFPSIMDAAGVIYDAPLFISDWPNMPILELKSQARTMVKDHGVKIIFIDYMGLIASERPDQQKWEQVSEISKTLKTLARELKIPIITLSQVSRDTEGKEPSLNNIRDSGAIEQDADMVMFIHRDRNTESDPENQPLIQETKLILAKQRNGPIGTVKVGYHSQYTLFTDMERN